MKRVFAIAFFVSFFCACIRGTQEKESALPIKTFDCFSASVERGNIGRLYLQGTDVKWNLGDCIAVFSDMQGPVPFVKGEDGFFHGQSVSGTVFYAVYPFFTATVDEQDPLLSRFEFNGSELPMVAKSSGNELLFKQTCGILHFRVKWEAAVPYSVSLCGNNDEYIGGIACVDVSENSPALSVTSAKNKRLVSQKVCVGHGAESDLYIPVPVQQFLKGFTVRIYGKDAGGNTVVREKVSSATLLVERAQMYSFPIIDLDAEGLVAEGLEGERNALIALYQATTGEHWMFRNNWCTDASVGEWYGITTDSEGYVVAINLPENNLDGCIPEEIGCLSRLETLNLKKNLIRTPIPESLLEMKVWKEYWGDILFGNKVYKEDFLLLNTKVPEKQAGMMQPGKNTIFLQWTPEKCNLDDAQFIKDSLVVSSLKKYWGDDAIDIVAWCYDVPESVISEASVAWNLPWSSKLEQECYPIQEFCPAIVVSNPEGRIIDTNLLRGRPTSGGGSSGDTPDDPEEPEDPEDPVDVSEDPAGDEDDGIVVHVPGVTPLKILVTHPNRLVFQPTLDVWYAESFVSISTNKNLETVRCVWRSNTPWIKFIEVDGDIGLILNGNPSVSKRNGRILLDIYYGLMYYGTVAIPVTQNGVFVDFESSPNIDAFDFYSGVNTDVYTIGFTPYGGTEEVVLRHNADGFLDLMDSNAAPTLITGEGFNASQVFPSLSLDSHETDIRHVYQSSVAVSYGSNRSFLNGGCFLNIIPLINVITDWNTYSYAPYYVGKVDGSLYYESIMCLQSPILISAEYDTYISEAIAASSAKPSGYNKLKAYSNTSKRTVAADDITIYSNVSWSLRDISFADEAWQYTIENAEDAAVVADGQHLEEFSMNMFVNDYLKTKTNGKYRPSEKMPTRQTALRVDIDLSDGKGPLTASLADIVQAGIPHVKIKNLLSGEYQSGEYWYNNQQYEFRVHLGGDLETDSDDLTDVFTGYPQMYISSSNGLTSLSNWGAINKWASSFSTYLYVNTQSDVTVKYDWKVPLSTGVNVYAESEISQLWKYYSVPSTSAISQGGATDPSPAGQVKKCVYRGKPHFSAAGMDSSKYPTRVLQQKISEGAAIYSVSSKMDIRKELSLR